MSTVDVSSARLASLKDPVSRIAEQAGQAILKLYENPTDVAHKGDGSPVTAADKAAHDVIVPALAKLTPEILIVSEEEIPENGFGQLPATFWLVDPLDGTKEYIKRNGEFTVNIALVHAGQPVLGVVHVPVTGETYAAAGAGTATWHDRTSPVRPIRIRPRPAAGLTVLASRSHADAAALDAFLASYQVNDFKQAGSSLKFCLIARGEADLYPRLGPTMEWDTAAAHAVLIGAGGSVEAESGGPLRYGKADFRNPYFVARGNIA